MQPRPQPQPHPASYAGSRPHCWVLLVRGPGKQDAAASLPVSPGQDEERPHVSSPHSPPAPRVPGTAAPAPGVHPPTGSPRCGVARPQAPNQGEK